MITIDSQSQVASYEKRMQFLLSVLHAEEKRRDAAENKSSILIASNAILLGAMTGFLLPLNNTGTFIFWIQVFLTIFVFGAVISSVMISAQVLAPFTTQGQRTRIMDLGLNPGSEYNLFLFARIAIFKLCQNCYLQEGRISKRNRRAFRKKDP